MSSRIVGWSLLAAGIVIAAVSGVMLLAPAAGNDAGAAGVPPAPTAAPTVAATVAPTTMPTITPTLKPAPAPEPSVAAAEVIRAFIPRLVEALRTGDAAFQVARLHPATLERYGEEQCRTELPRRQDATVAITVLKVGEPESWDYTTDGLSTTIALAVPVDADIVVQGKAGRQTLHFAIVDGTVLWFTDCGTPVTATPNP